MNYLDKYVGTYTTDFPYSLDNKLILNWYPQRILHSVRGNSVLELGLGHGYVTKALSKHCRSYSVVEGSEEVIKRFNDKNDYSTHQAKIYHSYFETFEPAEKFDIIIMGFVLEHVDNPKVILNKYKNYLNEGGSLFVTVPNAMALNKRIGYEAGILNDLFCLSKADLASGHKRLFSVESLTELVQECNYKIVKTEGIFLKPITTEQICKLELSDTILEAMLKLGVSYPELSVGILMQLEPLIE